MFLFIQKTEFIVGSGNIVAMSFAETSLEELHKLNQGDYQERKTESNGIFQQRNGFEAESILQERNIDDGGGEQQSRSGRAPEEPVLTGQCEH